MDSAARQAAEQIAALINSRVQSPRIDEMEAIIAGVTHVNTRYAHKAQDDPSLAALRQRSEAALGNKDAQRLRRGSPKRPTMPTVSWRRFPGASSLPGPSPLHNLKQRAVLARYWHQFAYDAEKWTTSRRTAAAGKTRLSPI